VYEALSYYLPASSFINFSTFSLRIVSAKLAFVTAECHSCQTFSYY
jgi:hypothetical protein